MTLNLVTTGSFHVEDETHSTLSVREGYFGWLHVCVCLCSGCVGSREPDVPNGNRSSFRAVGVDDQLSADEHINMPKVQMTCFYQWTARITIVVGVGGASVAYDGMIIWNNN